MDLGLKPLSEMAIRARIAFLAVALQIRRLGVRPPSIDGQLMMDRAGLCHPSCRSSSPPLRVPRPLPDLADRPYLKCTHACPLVLGSNRNRLNAALAKTNSRSTLGLPLVVHHQRRRFALRKAVLLFATGDVATVPGSHPITTIMRLPADTGEERLHQAG